jgi:hypothetical protein
MNQKIVDGKPYILGQFRSLGRGWDGEIIEMFDGEKFVSLHSVEVIDVHNKVLRDIYQRLDALEARK